MIHPLNKTLVAQVTMDFSGSKWTPTAPGVADPSAAGRSESAPAQCAEHAAALGGDGARGCQLGEQAVAVGFGRVR